MRADVTLRVATPKDDPLVRGLLEASYPPLMRPSYDQAVLAAALPLMTRANPALLSAGTFYLAARADDLIVGCGGWTRKRPGSGEVHPDLAHIRHFATHPDRLGRGIGRAIYARCEDAARSAGVRRLACYASLNAEGFYAAMGFKTVRRIEVPMGPSVTFPAALMERPI